MDSIETLVIPRTSDIGGLEVRRALPTARRRLVGPFIFFDRMGPAILRDGEALDVRPHPHIGLSTVTYLFDGHIRHRDSLGTEMVIRPGDVNLMTAGRGIVHSERSPEEERAGPMPISGVQTWLALPDAMEEIDPAFHHINAPDLPTHGRCGVFGPSHYRLPAWAFLARHPACRNALCGYPHPSGRALPDSAHDGGARHLYAGRQCRHWWRGVPARPPACFPPRRRYCRAGRAGGRAYHAFRWCAPRLKALYMVEFRGFLQRAHRTGKGRMAHGPFRYCAGGEQDFIPLPE
ncbi:pirin family protein [Brucella pinnipedialis M163/99/10]|nr:pirin family protein [Brucella pinnipedialis M163/99/10]